MIYKAEAALENVQLQKASSLKKKTNKPPSRWPSSALFKNKHLFGLGNFFVCVFMPRALHEFSSPNVYKPVEKPPFIWLHLDHCIEIWVHNCCLDTVPVPKSLNYFTPAIVPV